MFADREPSLKRHFRFDRVFFLPFIRAFRLVHAHGDFNGDEIGQVRKVLQVYRPNFLKLFWNRSGAFGGGATEDRFRRFSPAFQESDALTAATSSAVGARKKRICFSSSE